MQTLLASGLSSGGAEISRVDGIVQLAGVDENGVPRILVLNDDGTFKVSAGSQTFVQPDAGAVYGTEQAKLQEVVSVRDFGGDNTGVVNATDALYAASQAISARGGGTLLINPGTYLIGKQTFANGTGKGYSYNASPILEFLNLTKPLRIIAAGVKFIFASGLKFGSFDPVTGAAYFPTLPFFDSDYQAYVGYAIRCFNCVSVVIEGPLEIDGNISNLIIGGLWGDAGRQLPAYGIHLYENDSVSVRDVYTHHHSLDGMVIGHLGLTETDVKRPHTLVNVVSTYNARQGFSLVGSNSVTALNCEFSHTGRAVFSSSPSAGLDVEAEGSVNRNGLFINCNFEDNVGAAMVADSGDSADFRFVGCKFVGTTSWSLWPAKPRFTFVDCIIAGAMANSYASSTVPGDATKYVRCTISDEVKYGATLYGTGALNSLLIDMSTGTNIVLDRCTIVATRSKIGSIQGAILTRNTFLFSAGTTIITDQDWALLLGSSKISDNILYENITANAPATGYYIELSSTKISGTNSLTSASGYLRWFSWSTGAGGYTGTLLNTAIPTEEINLGYHGSIGVVNRILGGATPPSIGTWTAGDIVKNIAPVLNGVDYWLCTTSGTPGTWTPRYILAGTQTTNTILAGPVSGGAAAAAFRALVTADIPTTLPTLTGHLLFTDNTYDIGASGATRPRTGYFGTSLLIQADTLSAFKIGASADVILGRFAANILLQQNAANAQSFYVANTFTDVSNYEMVGVSWSAGAAYVRTVQLGTGNARPLVIGTDGAAILYFRANGAQRWSVQTAGHLFAETDNTYDIGASGATRPRTGYFGTSIVTPLLTMSAGSIATDTTTGLKIGTAGGASGQKLGFYNTTPVVQPLLATGAAATVDNIITALQTLGLVRQS